MFLKLTVYIGVRCVHILQLVDRAASTLPPRTFHLVVPLLCRATGQKTGSQPQEKMQSETRESKGVWLELLIDAAGEWCTKPNEDKDRLLIPEVAA